MFPISLDIDHPAFREGLAHLFKAQTEMDKAKSRGGLIGNLQRARWAISGAVTFVRLYFLPVQRHELPAQVRMLPAW